MRVGMCHWLLMQDGGAPAHYVLFCRYPEQMAVCVGAYPVEEFRGLLRSLQANGVTVA
jgi:hypothetical protein